ncbi:MAG: flagellar motor protein MotB [Myxococcales bacterium]
MARKKKHEEHVNQERWLVSYADFITLLFAFFTVLYATSQTDVQKLKDVMMAMREAFHVDIFRTSAPQLGTPPRPSPPSTSSMTPMPTFPGVRPSPGEATPVMDSGPSETWSRRNGEGAGASMEELKSIAAELQKYVQEAGLEDRVRVTMTLRGLVITLAEAGFFESGDATLRQAAYPILEAIARVLSHYRRPLRVEGHTDDRPISTSRFPSNWELSSARAAHIVRLLVDDFAYPPERLSASGYANYHPMAGNDTEEGRKRNRRVDVVVLSADAAHGEP